MLFLRVGCCQHSIVSVLEEVISFWGRNKLNIWKFLFYQLFGILWPYFYFNFHKMWQFWWSGHFISINLEKYREVMIKYGSKYYSQILAVSPKNMIIPNKKNFIHKHKWTSTPKNPYNTLHPATFSIYINFTLFFWYYKLVKGT